MMKESLSATDLAHVLTLIGEAHAATTTHSLRRTLIFGVGALMESNSCAWTELGTDLFKREVALTKIAETTDDQMDLQEVVRTFSQFAFQHPVIARIIDMNDSTAFSFSDLISRAKFNQLELYNQFYQLLSIEDQLSIGFVDGNTVIGLSVNRETWGFTDVEREMLFHIARCVFPLYRIMHRTEFGMMKRQPLIEANTNTIALHSKDLGVTSREAELLVHVARGKSNKQIAAACRISEGTVRKHLENAYRTLRVNNRMSAITKSMEIISQSEMLEQNTQD